MKSVFALVGLVVLVCMLVNSTTMRQNFSSWLGSCWNSTAYADPCVDQGAYPGVYQQHPQVQQFNRNVVVNRVFAQQSVRPAPVFYRAPVRPWFRQY